MFAALIQARQLPWNTRFGGRGVGTANASDVVVKEIDGLRITVAGPDEPALAKLTEKWVTEPDDEWQVYKSGAEALAALQAKRSLALSEVYLGQPEVPDVYDLANEPAAPDTSYTNASSIVLLLEHEGRTALLTGDATPPALDRAVDRLLAAYPDGLSLDVLKIPHHGSARNTTAATLKKIPAAAYLFSSGGGKHGRPHPQAVARCLQYGNSHAELVFNYRTPATMVWDAPERRSQKPYSVRYPDPGSEGVAITLTPARSS
jgi:hypothetical protein